MRIVSLLPSATETLCALGGGELLVGRSHECDTPESQHAPALTGQRTSYDPERGIGSAEIDAAVRAIREENQSLYTLDTELLAALKPDLILTQDLCDVCSIDLETVRRVAASIDPEPRVVSLNPETIEGVWDDILAIGEAAGLSEAARDLVVELRGRVFRAQEHVNQFVEGPVVGFLEWTDPLFCAGHWSVQLIERAGGQHPLNPGIPKPDAGAAAGPMQAERLAGKSVRVPTELFERVKPEWIIAAPCGLDLSQAVEETKKLLAQEWVHRLPAVQRGNVVAVDGNQMFNRPGPRVADAMEFLAGLLNDRPELIPDDFPYARVPVERS